MEPTMANDYYKTLGVERSASQDDISKAYRKLARKHHPDLNPEDKGAKKRFQEIQQAYDCLNDPEKRKKYDQFGEGYEQYAGPHPFAGGGNGPQGQGFDFNDIFGGSSNVDLGDIFRQFGGGAGPSTGRTRRGPAARGSDISAEIHVPLGTMIFGGDTQIQLERNGKMESLSVKVPAGIEPGKRIRLRGLGQPSPQGKGGDLLLKIHPEPHPFYKIVGNNLELRLPISLQEAVDGVRLDVQAPGGTVTLTIPPMSSSGKKLRVKGQGLRSSDGSVGDMFVELLIKLPEHAPDITSAQWNAWSKAYSKPLREGIRL